MSCDPNLLSELARCFQCLNKQQAEAVRNYLLCQINENGGGSGASQTYSTSDADPNLAGIVPSNPILGAIFFQDPSITLYNEWRWSVIRQTWLQTEAP